MGGFLVGSVYRDPDASANRLLLRRRWTGTSGQTARYPNRTDSVLPTDERQLLAVIRKPLLFSRCRQSLDFGADEAGPAGGSLLFDSDALFNSRIEIEQTSGFPDS
jgi:hypothetical protein